MIRCCTFSAQETWRRLSTVVLVHNSQSPNRGAGLRAFARLNTMSLCAAPRLYRRAHRALRIWAHKMSLQTSGAPAGDCECPCDGTEGWPWRWTQSHSSAIRGVAPIQAQIPTEIQRPSCCGKAGYQRSIIALGEKGGSMYLPLHAPGHKWTQCVFKRAKWSRLPRCCASTGFNHISHISSKHQVLVRGL